MKIRCSNFKNAVYSILSVIMLILAATPISYAAPIKLYWTDFGAGKIQSANADGTGLKDVLTGLTVPEAIAVDSPSGKMYWTSEGPVTIRRSNIDGSNVEGLRTGGRPQGIALDRINGKMYWTEPDLLQIRRANLNGSEEEIIVDLGNEFPGQFISPFGIAMDLENNKMYWTNEGDINIQRANLDGSGIENLVNGLSFPEAIALDLANRKMYWTDEADARIERANLNGTGREILFEGGSPEGIALDIDAGMMYWADNGGSIWKAELDGNNSTDIVMGLENPGGIVAVPLPGVSDTFSYTPVTPCRIVDTRLAGGAIPPSGIRSYKVWGAVASQGGNPAGCPSPKGEPRAVHINVTAVPLGNGWITAYPFGSAAPTASIVNYRSDAQNVANSGTIKTCLYCGKDISIKSGGGTTHVIIDVLGYYYAAP